MSVSAERNRVAPYIDGMPPGKRKKVITWAVVQLGKRGVCREKKTCQLTSGTFKEGSTETTKEGGRRGQQRNDKRGDESKKVESKLKTLIPGECQARFPELEMKSFSYLRIFLQVPLS